MLTAALGLERARLVALCGAGGKTTLMFALAREWAGAGERVLVTTTTKIARSEAAGPWPTVAAGSAEELLAHARRLFEQGGGALVAYAGAGRADGKLAGLAPELVDRLKPAACFDRILVEADGSARRPLKAPAAHEPVVPASSDAVIVVAGLNGLGRPLSADNLFRPEIWAQRTGLAPGAPISAESLAAIALEPEGLTKGCPARARRVLFLNRADTPDRRTAALRIALRIAAARGTTLHRVVAGCLLPAPALAALAAFDPPHAPAAGERLAPRR
ncbi:MAG: putative selenium-dependent hydroxylase accessory protein YqeC [Burkholderiales bacterium]|nr:putative selenium-dependent hydroxylase accessory protein YqeC [Burkholderiales bacterium]